MITGDHEKGCAYHKGLKCDCILTNGLRRIKAGLVKLENTEDLKSSGPKDLIGSIPMPGTKLSFEIEHYGVNKPLAWRRLYGEIWGYYRDFGWRSYFMGEGE